MCMFLTGNGVMACVMQCFLYTYLACFDDSALLFVLIMSVCLYTILSLVVP